MKTITITVTCCLFCFLFSFTSSTLPVQVDLIQALEKKLITVNAVSTGGNSENCVSLEVKNISGTALSLTLPAGSVMNTDNEGEQDILITKPMSVMVQNNASAKKELYGFCCQASNGVPAEGGTFKVEKCENESLKKLAEHLSVNQYDPMQEQSAIWAVSDNHSVGGIYDGDTRNSQQLREFTAKLLGQPVPFYEVDYGYVPNTPFVYSPKTLKGNMEYRILMSGKASLFIYNPDGEKFETFFEDRPMESGFYKQRFSYSATDMAAGTYKVKLIIDGRVVCENSITL